MMSSATQFTALGPTKIGFQTQGEDISVGAEIEGINDGVRGSCRDGGQEGAGVRGTARQNNGNGVIGEAHLGNKAYGVWGKSSSGFAGRFDGRVHVEGNLHVKGDLTLTGDKAAVLPFPDGSQRCLYAVESPESWFEDFGFGELMDGHVEIQLDSDFASVVDGDTYHVFISEYEENNALYVTARTGAGFEVRAKNPAASGQFSYRVVAKRRDKASQRFREIAIQPEKDLRMEAAGQDFQEETK